MPSKSKNQQKFFGVVRAIQKGEMDSTGEAGRVAKSMDPDDVRDYAKTKTKNLPTKVKQEVSERVLGKLTDWMYYVQEARSKTKSEPLTAEETKQFNQSHDKTASQYGVSLKKDQNGYFCHTHRARSKSKPSPAKITKTELKFIESTG